MRKIPKLPQILSLTPPSNHFCPQTLFVYGIYKEDDTPSFEKHTKDRIRATNIFSANLLTAELLSLADYFGNTDGYNKNKMDISVDTDRGQVLDVPVLTKSP